MLNPGTKLFNNLEFFQLQNRSNLDRFRTEFCNKSILLLYVVPETELRNLVFDFDFISFDRLLRNKYIRLKKGKIEFSWNHRSKYNDITKISRHISPGHRSFDRRKICLTDGKQRSTCPINSTKIFLDRRTMLQSRPVLHSSTLFSGEYRSSPVTEI